MNLPNFLTLIRFILIPFCGYALYTDRFLLAGILFVAACLTDLLDGYVARKYDMIT
ncbi:MAG TPA: CDP-diacylglycerol--glycerol-3-phosphate 3-phosphatidyltransferase, partial [Clostridiales bacterium]|nr:CDP-diacylglycerol--glycerol-3-phosphate 3-phosphatidyltransferase [Clostridiales bacterium]